MDPSPVSCPLCGAVVRGKPTADAADIRALARHFGTDCPAPAAARGAPAA